MADLITAVPFAVVSAAVSWGAQLWVYRSKRKETVVEQSDKLEMHRDQFTLELLQNARAELALMRGEITVLREEQGTLRNIEQHAYHFQESLEHLENLLLADSTEALAQAKRNATAFLNRMRRLQDAQGTVRNETQRQQSAVHLAEGKGPVIDV